MKVFGLWHGGPTYAPPTGKDLKEEFVASLREAFGKPGLPKGVEVWPRNPESDESWRLL